MTKQFAEAIDRIHAIEAFEKIVKNIKEANIVVPSIDKIMRFNNNTVVLTFYDKFFTLHEKNFQDFQDIQENDDGMTCVALGENREVYNRGYLLLLVDIRFMLDEKLFTEGVDAFINMSSEEIEGFPTEESDISGDLSHFEIVHKIAETYRGIPEQIIH